jgi:AcrR family transcriptional regulator
MSVNASRRYHSPQRQERANATRRHILDTATGLFTAQGYAAVTMALIARTAGVSPATLYLHFAGRPAIIGALAEQVTAAPDLNVEQVLQEAKPVEQLRIGARIMRVLNERSCLIADILRSFRGTDAEVARLWAGWQERHLEATRRASAAIARNGALRDGLTVETAADVLYAVAGTDVYRALVQERKWSPEQYERWLFEMACREILV